MRRALAAQRRRSSWRTGLVAVAASLALGFGVRQLLEPVPSSDAGDFVVSVAASPRGAGASLTVALSKTTLAPGAQLVPGAKLETARGGGAELELSTGTKIDLGDRTTLTVQTRSRLQRFSLAAGTLDATVAKLDRDERFVVETPDAEVEVRGTVFHLRVLEPPLRCASGSRTELIVSEGLVEVRAAGQVVRVPAGGRWPLDCSVSGAPVSSGQAPAPERTLAPKPGPGAAPASPKRGASEPQKAAESSSSSPPASFLAEHNNLFSQGVAAARAGDVSRALAAYERLIVTHPESPLSENAMVERMRLLSQSDRTAARREAQRYVGRYPNGFGRKEALQLLEAP